MPSRLFKASAEAEFRSILRETSPAASASTPPAADALLSTGAPSVRTSATSPSFGMCQCCSSFTRTARFSAVTSASSVTPPAPSTFSSTRDSTVAVGSIISIRLPPAEPRTNRTTPPATDARMAATRMACDKALMGGPGAKGGWRQYRPALAGCQFLDRPSKPNL